MQDQNDNLQSLLDIQQNELAAVSAVSDTIDGRNFAVLSANIAVIIFAAQSSFGFDLWQYGVLLPLVASTLINMSLISLAPYRGNADLSVHPEYLSAPRDELLLQLISDTQAAIETNSKLNGKRQRRCMLALWLFILGVVLLSATIIIWAKQ